MPPAETPKVLAAEPGGPKQHWSIDVAFPVYAIAFTNDRTIVLGGGGGSSRTGVRNRLVSCSLQARVWAGRREVNDVASGGSRDAQDPHVDWDLTRGGCSGAEAQGATVVCIAL